jgi:hypothetical protein
MSLTRIPSSLVANTFTSNTVLFANALGYLSNSSSLQYFSGNNTIAVGAVVAGGIDVINYTQAAFNAANAAGSSAYVQSAYDQANTATGIAQAAFNSANNVAPQVQPAFNKANSANVLAQAAYDSSNAVNQYATSAYGVANTNATNITLVNQYAVSGYNQANTATGIAQAAFNSANNVAPQVQPAFDKANAANSLAQSAYDSSNAVNQYAVSAYNAANTNNSAIIAVNQYAASAYYNGNLNTTNITSVNQYAVSAFNTANSASSNTIYHSGVNVTQNTNITYATAIAGYAWDTANIAIQRLDNGTGVQATQNTRIDGLEGANLTQNTNITTANNAAWAAYAAGNTNATNITAVNNFAQSAYNTANTKFNSSGGNITGSVTISGNNDLTVTGNLYLTGTQFVSNTQSFATQDPLLVLGLGNYTSDAVDIGFASHYNDGSNAHTGLIRDYGTKEYYFFKGYTPELDTNNNININDVSFSTANVNAGYFRGNIISNGYNVLDFAQAAYNSANNVAPQVQPAFDKANTASANTIIIQGVDLTQNTNITTANNAAWAAYAAGNTNATNITLVNQFAQSAYNAANAAGSSSYVQAAFDKANTALANTTGTFSGDLTTTGNVRVTSTQTSTSTTTGALTVSGGVGVTGNIYAGNIYTNGALINNSAALTVYKYVATAGQTTFSGTDVNSLTLSYVASAIFVTLNGVVLNNTLEYTATNGTSVVLGTAAELDDELNIYSFGAFQIADTYTITQADSKFLTQANAITDYVSTANGTAINQFAAGAYTTANTAQTTATGANGLAAGAYNTANGANGFAEGAFNTANGANGLASGAFNKANNAVAQTGGSITGSLSVSQDLTVTGNLTVLGNSTSIGVSTLEVSDPLIVLGIGNYTTDIVDIGFAGHYNDGANAHTGLMRDFGTKEYYFFKDYTPELGSNNNINIAHPSFATTNVYASFFKGDVISQGYNLFNYTSAAFTQANTAYTNAVNGSNTSVQFASVGVGTAASGTYGEIRAINNITGYYSSDKKYKENVINIPDALNKVDAIGGKMFDWTDSYIQEHGGEDGYFVQKRDFGVIAQDVQAVFPEAVRTREDGSLAVDYSKLSALAFAAIIELKKEIEQLKNNK